MVAYASRLHSLYDRPASICDPRLQSMRSRHVKVFVSRVANSSVTLGVTRMAKRAATPAQIKHWRSRQVTPRYHVQE